MQNPQTHTRLLDSPPLPQTRFLAGEYVFDAETAATSAAKQDVGGLLHASLFWRDAWAIVASRHGTNN